MSENIKIITTNKKARFDYRIIESIEAGLVLKGTEVKSLRNGKCSLQDSYARVLKGEVWVIGMRISKYENEGMATHDPTARRKLLLHKLEIKKLLRQVQEKGVTLIPLKIYFKNGKAKLEIGLASGKRQHDKRADIAERERKREQKRLEKQYRVK